MNSNVLIGKQSKISVQMFLFPKKDTRTSITTYSDMYRVNSVPLLLEVKIFCKWKKENYIDSSYFCKLICKLI